MASAATPAALPFSVFEPGYTTDWQLGGPGVVTAPVKVHRHIVNGVPQVFAGDSATAINNGVTQWLSHSAAVSRGRRYAQFLPRGRIFRC